MKKIDGGPFLWKFIYFFTMQKMCFPFHPYASIPGRYQLSNALLNELINGHSEDDHQPFPGFDTVPNFVCLK